MIIALLIAITFSSSAQGFNPFSGYDAMKPEQQITTLQAQQSDHPHDPVINYNLGVALYKNNKFQEARENFDRAYQHCKDNVVLKKLCSFNLANSSYKNVIEQLPDHWQDTKVTIQQEKLESLIKETQQALASYNHVLELDKNHTPALVNKQKSDDLLKKLEKKRQQQEQQKQDQQDDKHKDNQENKQDQSQEQQQDEQQQNSEQEKNGGSSDNKHRKEQEKHDKKSRSTPKDNEEKDQGQRSEDHEQTDGKNRSDNSHTEKTDRDNKKLKDNQSKNSEQRNVNEHATPETDKASHDPSNSQPTPSEPMQSEQEKQDFLAESAEMRKLRAVLENLQADESKAQKHMLRNAVSTTKTPLHSGQKPW